MGLASIDSNESIKRSKQMHREKRLRFASQASICSVSSKFKPEGPTQIDLDVSKPTTLLLEPESDE